jgi:hypothetical protein
MLTGLRATARASTTALVATAVDVHHAEHFVASLEPGGLCTAFFNTPEKSRPNVYGRRSSFTAGYLPVEVDRIDTGRVHRDQHLAGVREGWLDIVSLEDFLATEAMYASL